MKQILSNFRNLLIGNSTVCIACIDDRTEWTISPKDTVEEFIESITNVANDAYGINAEEEERECEVLKAESFDYDYSIEVVISVPISESQNDDRTIYLYHANKF